MSEVVFTLDDLNNPILVKVYTGFVNFCTTVTLIGFILLMYMVIKKPGPDMGEYRYYIAHQLSWSFVLNLHLAFWKPVPLWPFYFGYSNGLYAFLPEDYKYFPIIFFGFIIVGMWFSIYLSTIHRYISGDPNSKFGEIFRKKWYIKFIHFIVFCGLAAGVCVSIYLRSRDSEASKTAVLKRASFMQFFFDNYPSMTGYYPTINENISTLSMNALLLIAIGILVFTFLLYNAFLRILKKNQTILGENVYKMQRMLLKSWSVQIGFVVLFLLLPTMISIALAVFEMKWAAKLSLLAISINCLHAMADYVFLCLYIQPYRTYLKEKIACLFSTCEAYCKVSGIESFTSGIGNSVAPN